MTEALEWAKSWQGAREFEALDAFGFSQGIACLVCEQTAPLTVVLIPFGSFWSLFE